MKRFNSFLAFSVLLHGAASLVSVHHGMPLIGGLFALVAMFYIAVLCILSRPIKRHR